MCGVAAMFAYHYAALDIDREELRLIRDAMATRGPDGSGEWFSEDGKVALGHRRLAIIDPSDKGSQPMANVSKTKILSFNGEIYNYRELRAELERKGRRFVSGSDTEVLLHLYEEKGIAMLGDLRGMFAFVIWDAKENKMILARDPYGIKPLYYADDGWTLRAASQVKALLAGGKVSKLPEPAGVVGFFLMGSVPEPYTLYQEIRQVPAGGFVIVDSLGPSAPSLYFSIPEILSKVSEFPEREDLFEKAATAVSESVRYHLVADVPVALFLSAGIDSGSLLSIASREENKLRTLTLAFEEFRGTPQDEAPQAERTAAVFGSRHLTRYVKLSEAKAALPDFFEKMDQPTLDGMNVYFIAKAAKENGLKVALTGLGADELFGGYSTFGRIPAITRSFGLLSKTPLLGDIFRVLSSELPWKNPKYSGLLKYGGDAAGAYFLTRGLFMPWELRSVMKPELAEEGLKRLKWMNAVRRTVTPDPGSWFSRVLAMESSLYMKNQLLRDADWAGMAHSIEIRTPFVDARLLKELSPVLASKRKPKGKELLVRHLPRPLPREVVERPKTGFMVPVHQWLESEKELSEWRSVPVLAKKNCPWARRWAYMVHRRLVK